VADAQHQPDGLLARLRRGRLIRLRLRRALARLLLLGCLSRVLNRLQPQRRRRFNGQGLVRQLLRGRGRLARGALQLHHAAGVLQHQAPATAKLNTGAAFCSLPLE
jgi:hypothetical protein